MPSESVWQLLTLTGQPVTLTGMDTFDGYIYGCLPNGEPRVWGWPDGECLTGRRKYNQMDLNMEAFKCNANE